jgi:tetratricopeptide (TPR) repeat protein
VPIEGALPDEFVDSLPEPRRTLHRRAVEVIARHRREGAPYALVLRNYGVVQLFGGTAQRLGDVFENVLVDALEPAGVGVVQVQPPRTEPITAQLYAPLPGNDRIRAPSLYVDPARWWHPAVELILGAELVVILLPQITPGVGVELDAVLAAGRADRTVVLVSGEDLGGPEDGTRAFFDDDLAASGKFPDTSATMRAAILRRFPRVVWTGDLAGSAPLEAFVFADLVGRLRAIARLSPARRLELDATGRMDTVRPPDMTHVLDGYERLALFHRARNRSDVAALYHGVAARHATNLGRVSDAVEHACASADLLTMFGHADSAHDALAEIRPYFDDRARDNGDNPGFVRAYTTLVAEQARMLTHAKRVDAAKQLLAEQAARCSSPRDPLALSTLRTALAWTLRTGTDPDAVLAAGSEAFRLAEEAGDGHAAGRALTVLGATLHDLRDLEYAESYLVHALDRLPPNRHYRDRWRALLRLGEVLRAQGRPDAAGSALRMAEEAAERGSYGWCADAARERLAEID